jgi:hypothetical protein
MKNHKSVMEDIEQEPKNAVLSAPKTNTPPPSWWDPHQPSGERKIHKEVIIK